jgi:hypothetical protein
MSRGEWVKVVVIGLVVGSVFALVEIVLGWQGSELRTAKEDAEGKVQQEELAKAVADIKKAKSLTKSNASRKGILEKVENYFPREKGAITTLKLVHHVPKDAMKSSNKGAARELFWKPASGESPEGEGDDANANANAVKYVEQEHDVKLRATFEQWLEFLDGVEKLRSFYRIKQLSMKSVAGHRKSETALNVELSIGTYHVVDFPSERSAAPQTQ